MKQPRFALHQAEARIVRIPLRSDLVMSEEFGDQVPLLPRLILRLVDTDGFEGWGETVATPGCDYEALLQRLLAQENPLLPFVRAFWGADNSSWLRPAAPSPYEAVVPDLVHRLRNPFQPAFESAVLDLLGQRAGVPVCHFLGGPWRDEIPVHFWMGRVTPGKAAEVVRYSRELGFRGIKFKTTLRDPNIERLEAILEAGGPDWPVTIDANGRFFRIDDALRQILALDQVGNLDILEDPFPRFHLGEFAALRSRITARVVVHIDPPETIGQVITSGAAGGLNLDCTGVYTWLEQAAAAAAANLPVWHGSGLDLGIATALQLHLMAAARNALLPGDQAGPWVRETSLLKTPFAIREGSILLPQGAGLGIEVDVDELDRRTEQRVVISKN